MKIAITVKTGKGEKSTEKEVDKTVDEVMKISSKINGKLNGERCFCDGTRLVLEKN